MSRPNLHHGFRRLLERDDLTHDDAAQFCGCHPSHLSNFLAGRVSQGTREKIEPRLAELFYAGSRPKLRRALARTHKDRRFAKV